MIIRYVNKFRFGGNFFFEQVFDSINIQRVCCGYGGGNFFYVTLEWIFIIRFLFVAFEDTHSRGDFTCSLGFVRKCLQGRFFCCVIASSKRVHKTVPCLVIRFQGIKSFDAVQSLCYFLSDSFPTPPGRTGQGGGVRKKTILLWNREDRWECVRTGDCDNFCIIWVVEYIAETLLEWWKSFCVVEVHIAINLRQWSAPVKIDDVIIVGVRGISVKSDHLSLWLKFTGFFCLCFLDENHWFFWVFFVIWLSRSFC